MRTLIIELPDAEYNNVLQYATKKGGKVKTESKAEKPIVKNKLLTGLETSLKQAKAIQSGKAIGFSISDIVSGK